MSQFSFQLVIIKPKYICETHSLQLHAAWHTRPSTNNVQARTRENCMCLAANRYLFQYSNGYIQIISFQTVSCMQFFCFLSLQTKYSYFPIRVSLSQVRRLNALVAICRIYRLSEDIALILMYKLTISKRSDRLRWA